MLPSRQLFRLIRRRSPALGARLKWRLHRYKGDPTPRILEALVHTGDVVVDVGAGWGFYTWLLVKLVGPHGRVHAVEPNPVSAESLKALSRRHENVFVYDVAAGDDNGEGSLHIPVIDRSPIDALGTLSPPEARSDIRHVVVSVPIARLDDLIAERERIAFIKCDVEGHELAVIEGAREIIDRSMPALLVEIEQRHQNEAIPRIFEHLRRLDYVGYCVQRGELKPLEEFDPRSNQQEAPSLRGASLARYLEADYTSDFLFVSPGTDVEKATSGSRG